MKEILLVIVIATLLIAIGVAVYFVSHANKIKMENNQPQPAIWSTEQQKALLLADRELEAHFPDKVNFGIVYQPTNVMAQEKPANSLDTIYVVTYDLPGGPTDQDVWITVDVAANKVVSYSKPQS
jgi:hypothetical protein